MCRGGQAGMPAGMISRLFARLEPWRRFRESVSSSGRAREGVVQAAKMAVAAVLAWWVAQLVDDRQPFIAAYTAVFLMTGTVYRSVLDAVRQVTTVLLGVLVAFGAVLVVPWPSAELAVAVFVGVVIGRWHRLGKDGIWVGVVALLMVTYGAADDSAYLALRVGEALFGAFVGVAVNALVLPPLYLRHAGSAVATLSAEIAELLDAITGGLRDDWDEHDAHRWRRTARQLEASVRHAEDAVGEGHESTVLNLRRRTSRHLDPIVEDRAFRTLYEVAEQVKQLTETLVTAEEPDNDVPGTGSTFDTSLADLLAVLTDAVRVYREPPTNRYLDRDALTAALEQARERRAALARLVPSPDLEPPKDWSAHAAVLLATQRALRVLLEADTAVVEIRR